jgi:hypothetical protein
MSIFGWLGCNKKADFEVVEVTKANADLDERVLVQLRKANLDLSQPRKIDFYLYFPTQSAAEQVAPRIRDAGFQVEVRRAAKGDDWLCLSTRTMVPDLKALQQVRHDFQALVTPLKGDYDGWDTAVLK